MAMPRDRRGGHAGRYRLRSVPAGHPRRQHPKPLGVTNDGMSRPVGLSVPDARHHIHVLGVTGSGKSTWLAQAVLAEARAGRGVVLIDCQGDLARHVLDRLPESCGDRLVVLDPAEQDAPAAWNVLAADGGDREWAAENVVGVFRRLYAQWWGPRMDDVLRAACLTLVRRSGSTLADVIPLLTVSGFRRALVADVGEPPGLEGFWAAYDNLTPGQQAQLCGPVISRLRAVLTRRFARDLLGAPRSTINLTEILNGGVLIARLAKGEIGEDTARLVGSLLLSGLWAQATRRSALPTEKRPDATIVVDECHNFLHLPIGVEDALAEARGYRVSLVLAHQHLGQLPDDVREAIDANARNKVFFTVSPTDARRLARHLAPYFDEDDLSHRGGFQVTCRTLHLGHERTPYTLDTEPLPVPVPGRARALRAAARARTGLPRTERDHSAERRDLAAAPGIGDLADNDGQHPDISPGDSLGSSLGNSPSNLRLPGELPTRSPITPQVNDTEEGSCDERDWL